MKTYQIAYYDNGVLLYETRNSKESAQECINDLLEGNGRFPKVTNEQIIVFVGDCKRVDVVVNKRTKVIEKKVTINDINFVDI